MALILPAFLDCVVAIGYPQADGSSHWAATGFFFGQLLRQPGPEGKQYRVFLVTNRHVLEDQRIVRLRLNPQADKPAQCFDLDLAADENGPGWLPHPDPEIDIAAARVSTRFLTDQSIQFEWFENDIHALDRAQARDHGVSEGDGVFVLGFPLGTVGKRRNYVVVRSGHLARIRECLNGETPDFLLDASVFPGNSGGPVVLRPEADAIRGTRSLLNAYLIGIVAGYLPYEDVAISPQTKRPRVVFEENSGLAVAYPVDFITQLVRTFPAPVGFELACGHRGVEQGDEADGAPVPSRTAWEPRSLSPVIGGQLGSEETGSEEGRMSATNNPSRTQAFAWCATCGGNPKEVEVDNWLAGRRFRCARGTIDDFHVAAVMDTRLLWWLRLQACLARYGASRYHPRFFLFRRRVGPYVAFLGVLLAVAYWLTPSGMTWAGVTLAAFVLTDTVLYNSMVAFVTQHPRVPMRTVFFAIASFIAIACAFGVAYRALPHSSFDAPITTDFDAAYFSAITLATIGYGDIHPQVGAGVAQALVFAEVGVGLYFLAALFTIMTSWASNAPTLPTLDQLRRELDR